MFLPTTIFPHRSEYTYFISKTDFIPHNADRGWLHVADVSNKDPSCISRWEWRRRKEKMPGKTEVILPVLLNLGLQN